MSKIVVRAGVIATAAAVLTLVSGAAAEAHVRVFPDSTASGGYTKLTFRVPNESATASTTSLVISLPTDTPLASVSARPTFGWTVKIAEAKLPKAVDVGGTTLTEAPSTVTWTAEKGQAVGPGEFQEFALSVGPLPAAATELSFPATQTYSDGTVVKWDQPESGPAEPEHPVPAFEVTAVKADPAAVTPAVTAGAAGSGDGDGSGLATGLAAGGLAVGLIGLGVGGLAWRKANALARPVEPARQGQPV